MRCVYFVLALGLVQNVYTQSIGVANGGCNNLGNGLGLNGLGNFVPTGFIPNGNLGLGPNGLNLGPNGLNCGPNGLNLGPNALNLGPNALGLNTNGLGCSNGLAPGLNLGQGFVPSNFGPGMAGTPIGYGDVAVIGELPVGGSTTVAGQVPVIGYVTFEGTIPAGGLVSVANNGCGCNGPVY